MHELILGGAKSGKSRAAEQRAAAWLAADPDHRATLIATALPADAEMAERIARHRADRTDRLPRLACVEAPHALGAIVRGLAHRQHLLLIDCLTLWLTQCLMPPLTPPLRPPLSPPKGTGMNAWPDERSALLDAMRHSASPLVLVSNEIGLGGMPMSREARACVDALGLLHQAVAQGCSRVTLMVTGCELNVKDTRPHVQR